MIIYFTATGNSKYTAERLAKALADTAVSCTSLMERGEKTIHLKEGERLGIVSPTYCSLLPSVMERFLCDLKIEWDGEAAPYLYFVATYALSPGMTGKLVRRILRENGYRLSAAFGVPMQNNCTMLVDVTKKETVASHNAKGDEAIDRILPSVIQCEPGNRLRPELPLAMENVFRRFYDGIRATAHWKLKEDRCTGCGLCQKICPEQAIRIENGKPVWVKSRCSACFACLHRCPAFAIQHWDFTEHHGQYVHPDTDL